MCVPDPRHAYLAVASHNLFLKRKYIEDILIPATPSKMQARLCRLPPVSSSPNLRMQASPPKPKKLQHGHAMQCNGQGTPGLKQFASAAEIFDSRPACPIRRSWGTDGFGVYFGVCSASMLGRLPCISKRSCQRKSSITASFPVYFSFWRYIPIRTPPFPPTHWE